MRGVELLDLLGMLCGDGSIANVFADHGAILAFHQSVFRRAVRPGLGEFDQ